MSRFTIRSGVFCRAAALSLALWVALSARPAASAAAETADTAEKAEGGELRVWVMQEDQGLRAAFRRFERMHPGWKIVETIYAASEGEGAQKLMTAIVGGSPPDVLMQDRFNIGEWAARAAFRPLDDLIAGSQGDGRPDPVREADFYPTAWREGVYEGRPYGVPLSIDTRALYYNEDHLRDAGFVDGQGNVVPPKTWQELRDYTVRLTRRDADGRIERLGFAPSYGNSWLYIYGFLNGGKFMSDDGRTALLNSPQIVEALAYMRDLYDLVGGAARANSFLTGQTGNEFDPFGTGRVSMKIDGDFSLKLLAEYYPSLPFAVAPPPAPAGRETTTWSGGFSYVIPQTAPDPKMSFELIRYLVSDDGWDVQHQVNARYSASKGRAFIPQMTAQPAVNALVLDVQIETDPNVPPRVKRALRTFYNLIPRSQFRPVTPVGQMLWDQHRRATEQATLGGMDPKRALDEGAARVQEALDASLRDVESPGPPVNWAAVVPLIGGACVLGLGVLVLSAWRRGVFARYEAGQMSAAALFLSPWLLGFVVLLVGPIVASLVFAFCRYSVLHPAEWSGLTNLHRLLFDDDMFWKSLLNTAYMLIGVPLGMAVGLGIALLLNSELRGMKVYRTLFYLPAIVPIVASAILWVWVLNPTNGLVNALLLMMGVSDPPSWLNSSSWVLGSKAAILLMGLWSAGAGMIIWLAGLKGIPRHLYEAATIDGAGPWSQFRHVTLPMLSPYISFNLIIGTIATMQIFSQAFIMTQGGPADSTMFYAYYLFNNAFRYFEMGYASALAWVLLLMILALTAAEMWSSKKWVHYGA